MTLTFLRIGKIRRTVHLRRGGLGASLWQHLNAIRIQFGNGGNQIIYGVVTYLVNGFCKILGVLSQ